MISGMPPNACGGREPGPIRVLTLPLLLKNRAGDAPDSHHTGTSTQPINRLILAHPRGSWAPDAAARRTIAEHLQPADPEPQRLRERRRRPPPRQAALRGVRQALQQPFQDQ